MNRENDNLFTIDRLLLLGVLALQAIIICLLLSPSQDAHKVVPLEAPQSEQEIQEEEPEISMSLPLPPGFDDEDPPLPSEDPSEMLNRMQDSMDELMRRAQNDFDQLERLMNYDAGWNRMIRSPSMDITEEDKSYSVMVSLPSPDVNDIKISLDGRILTISTVYTMKDTMGSSRQSLRKSILLPGPVDSSGITKTISDDGILEITIPKLPKGKQI
ncbi:hypothetical protein BVX97_05350 [bacterium E08(2017)]|nr:hypothetical protein BVX97_05350 [bacterium E08(2017)]